MNLLSVAKTVTKNVMPNIIKYGKKFLGETPSLFEKSGNYVKENINLSRNNSIFSELRTQMTRTGFEHELTNFEERMGKNLHEKKFFSGIGDIVSSFLPEGVKETVKKVIKKGKVIAKKESKVVENNVFGKDESILNTFKTKLNGLKDKIFGGPLKAEKVKMVGCSSGIDNFGKRMHNGVNSIGNKIFSKSQSAFKNIYSKISKATQKAFNAVKNGFNNTIKTIKTTAQNIYNSVVNSAKTILKTPLNKVNSAKITFKNVVAKIKSGIKKVNKFLESKNTKVSKNITKSNKDSQLIKKKSSSVKPSSKTSVNEPLRGDKYQVPVVKSKKENSHLTSLSKENVTNREIVPSNKVETHVTNTASSNPFINEQEFDTEIQRLFQITESQGCKTSKKFPSMKVYFAKASKVNFSKYQIKYGMGAFEECIKDNGGVRAVISVLNDTNASDVNINKAIKWLISNPQKQTNVIMNLNGNNLAKALKVSSTSTLEKLKTKTLSNAYATKIKEKQIEELEGKLYSFIA